MKMKKTIAILLASAVAFTAVPARASDELLRLGIGLGAHVIGEAIKGAKNRPKATQRSQSSKQSSSRSSGSSKASTARAAPAPKRQADPQVQEAQQLLSDLGYTQVGKPDGFAGNNTTKAILAFKKDHGLDGDDAKIDGEFIAALKAIKTNPAPTAVAPTAATAGAAVIANADTAQAPAADVSNASAEPEMSQEEYLAAVAAEGPISSQDPISEDIAEAVAAIQAPQPDVEPVAQSEAKEQPAEVAKVEEQKPEPAAVEPTPAPVEAEGFTISADF